MKLQFLLKIVRVFRRVFRRSTIGIVPVISDYIIVSASRQITAVSGDSSTTQSRWEHIAEPINRGLKLLKWLLVEFVLSWSIGKMNLTNSKEIKPETHSPSPCQDDRSLVLGRWAHSISIGKIRLVSKVTVTKVYTSAIGRSVSVKKMATERTMA